MMTIVVHTGVRDSFSQKYLMLLVNMLSEKIAANWKV
jgi:hypothetical protein